MYKKIKIKYKFFFCILLLSFFWVLKDQYIESKFEGPVEHFGLCDGSAGVGIGEDRFIVGEDEENRTRFYYSDELDSDGKIAIDKQAIDEYLHNVSDFRKYEADIEGATKMGDYIFWITSHGRNKRGKFTKKRYRFFALKILKQGDFFEVKTVGVPYEKLIDSMMADKNLSEFKVAPNKTLSRVILETTRLEGKGNKKKPSLSPDKNGLNIEGLSGQPDGSILIAFRNPRPGPNGEALLIPLKNPLSIVLNQEKPEFGKPILLKLGEGEEKLGFRGIEYSTAHNKHIIIAGSHDDGGIFRLYEWSGLQIDSPVFIKKIENHNPESVIVYANTKYVKLLSDDGSMDIEIGWDEESRESLYVPCKELDSFEMKRFRSFWVYVN